VDGLTLTVERGSTCTVRAARLGGRADCRRGCWRTGAWVVAIPVRATGRWFRSNYAGGAAGFPLVRPCLTLDCDFFLDLLIRLCYEGLKVGIVGRDSVSVHTAKLKLASPPEYLH